MKKLLFALAFTIAVLFAAPASAQVTGPCNLPNTFQVGPNAGCFTPIAAEHNATDPVTGAPNYTIVRYDVLYFDEAVNVATGQEISRTSIGKPAINAGGAIWFGAGTSTPLPAYPLGRRLKAVIVPVGPTGLESARSATNTSNSFGQSAPSPAPTAPTNHRMGPNP